MTTRRILIAIGFVTALVVTVLFTVTSVGGSVLEPIEGVLRTAAAPAPDPPGLINFQGRLTDSGTGDPVADGSYSVRFSIWDAAAAGNEQWNETQGSVTVTDGLFSVLLGSVTPITKGVFSATDRYLEIKVGADPAMTPRQRFAAVAYAFVALNANTADTAADLTCAACVGVGELAVDSVKTFNIIDGTVSNADLAPNSVFSTQIKDGQVKHVDLGIGSVESDTIRDGAVSIGDMGVNSVKGVHIVDTSVGVADLAPNAVNSSKIADGTVELADLAANSVNSSKIADGTVAKADLAADSVNSSKIADGTVTKADLAADSVNGSKIADATVGIADLSISSVDTFKIVDGTVAIVDLANSFLRDNVSDTYSGLVLTIGTTSRLDYDNAGLGLELSNNGGEGDQFIDFFDSGVPTGESLQWADGLDRFEFTDDLHVSGTLTATTKSAVVETSQGPRLTYVQESTGQWFEDFGSARLDAGSAVVEIESLFAETVNTDIDYHVYLTPLGATSGLYVANKGADSFEVRASDGADLAFDYRIVAKRLGYEDDRLEPFNVSEPAERSERDAGLDSAAADVAPQAGSPGLADGAAEGAGGPLYALFIALPLAGAAFMLLAAFLGRKRLLKGRS